MTEFNIINVDAANTWRKFETWRRKAAGYATDEIPDNVALVIRIFPPYTS